MGRLICIHGYMNSVVQQHQLCFAPEAERRLVESQGTSTCLVQCGALSALDLQLLLHASIGMVDKRIARHCGLNPDRVHERWRKIRRVLGASDRTHAVALALSMGLIPPPENPPLKSVCDAATT